MYANTMYKGNYILFYPMAIAGIIVTNNMFRIIYANSNYRFIILEYIGRNSMNIYVTHWILFVLVSFIAKSLLHIESAAILFYCFLAASIIFLPIICYFMNKIGKQNKMAK
jgi:fucose 4-O-acetylase-like acetyltransferase